MPSMRRSRSVRAFRHLSARWQFGGGGFMVIRLDQTDQNVASTTRDRAWPPPRRVLDANGKADPKRSRDPGCGRRARGRSRPPLAGEKYGSGNSPSLTDGAGDRARAEGVRRRRRHRRPLPQRRSAHCALAFNRAIYLNLTAAS